MIDSSLSLLNYSCEGPIIQLWQNSLQFLSLLPIRIDASHENLSAFFFTTAFYLMLPIFSFRWAVSWYLVQVMLEVDLWASQFHLRIHVSVTCSVVVFRCKCKCMCLYSLTDWCKFVTKAISIREFVPQFWILLVVIILQIQVHILKWE